MAKKKRTSPVKKKGANAKRKRTAAAKPDKRDTCFVVHVQRIITIPQVAMDSRMLVVNGNGLLETVDRFIFIRAVKLPKNSVLDSNSQG